MKTLSLVTILVTTTISAQNTIDQIRSTIQQINQLARSIPELTPLLNAYNQARTQMNELKRSTGLDKILEKYAQDSKKICLTHEGRDPLLRQRERDKIEKIRELGGEKYRTIRRKIEQLDQKIYLEIIKLRPQAEVLYEDYGNLLRQLAIEKPCEREAIVKEVEDLLYLS